MIYQIYAGHDVKDILEQYEDRHYNDIKDKSLYPSKSVNWEVYEELSKLGLCFVVLVKDNESLVGYMVYTLTADLNNNNKILAIGVAMYIEKRYRGKMVVEFIRNCDNMLKDKEVKQVLHTHSDVRIGKLLEKAGYTTRSITWCKSL